MATGIVTVYRVTRHVSSESKFSASEKRPRSAEFSEMTSLFAREVFFLIHCQYNLQFALKEQHPKTAGQCGENLAQISERKNTNRSTVVCRSFRAYHFG